MTKNNKHSTKNRKAAESFVPPVNEIMDAVRRKFGIREWVRRDAPKRIDCPIKGYEKNYVILPKEWIGEHLLKRDEIVKGLEEKHRDSEDMRRLAISLGLAEKIHIPAMGKNPEDWDITKVPLPVLSWLVDAVFGDFIAATFVPKAE